MSETNKSNPNPYPDASHLMRHRAEVVWMTPEHAKHIRESCHFERQRQISVINVERLSNEMTAGWFVEATPIFFAVMPDNSMLLLNGNHSLEAVQRSGVSTALTCIYSRVTNIEAAAKIYATFDIHKVRSWGATMRALGVGDDILRAEKVLAACVYLLCDFDYDPADAVAQSRTMRIAMMQEYGQTANMLAEWWAGTNSRITRQLYQAPVFAVALATSRYQPSAAQEFWGGIARDELPRGAPGKALMNYLENIASKKNAATKLERIKAAVLAWNAAFQGAELTICKPNQMGNFVIRGTKWHAARITRTNNPSATKSPNRAVHLPLNSSVATGHKMTSDGSLIPVSMFQA